MLKAILFDLDDTLIDWGKFNGDWSQLERRHIEGVHQYITANIQPIGDIKPFQKEYMRRTRKMWNDARHTLDAPNVEIVLRETAIHFGISEDKLKSKDYLKAYNWAASELVTVFPDVIEGLTRLTDAGLKLGLITNAYQPMWMRDIEMKAHGLLRFFPTCRYSAADVGKLKPHPKIFKTALDCLGIDANEAIFIGDNPTADIAGSQSAGMKAILRIKKPAKRLLSGLVVPDAAINTFHELPAILDDWHPEWSNNRSNGSNA